MSTSDDLRAIRDDIAQYAAATNPTLRLVDWLIERESARESRESATEPIEVDIVPDTSAFQIAMLTAERDRLRAEVRHLHAVIDGDESVRGASWKRLRRDRDEARAERDGWREAAHGSDEDARHFREKVREVEAQRDEARAEADSLRGQIKSAWQEAHGRPEESILNAVQRLLAERREARNRAERAEGERDDLAALVARQREDGQRKDAALVRAKAKRRKAEGRAAHWKVNAGLYDAAALSNIERADDAEDAIARVRALLDGRAMVPVGLLREALDGVNPTEVVRDDPAQGSTAGGNGHESDAGAAEVSASGPGAARAVEGQESVSDEDDRLDLACAWSDYRREYGVSSDLSTMLREHKAFTAGWQAARGTLDLGGVQR